MSYSTILVYVGGDLVGDALIKLPFIAALRHNNPQAHITWCTGEFSSVFETVLEPLVRGKLDRITTLEKLSSQKFDLVIDTQSEWFTTLKLKLKLHYQSFFSPALGYLLSDFKPLNNHTSPKRLIDKMLDFLRTIGMKEMPENEVTLDKALQDKAKELLPDGKTYIGFAVGAGYRSKCWPREHYISLGKDLKKQGYEPVVILGPQEQDWVEAFQEQFQEALYPLQDARVTQQSPYSPLHWHSV